MIIFTLIIAASLPVLFYLLSKKKTVSSNPPAENSSFLVDSPEDELMQNLGDRFKKYMGSLSDDNLDFNELAKEVKLFADNGLCEAQWMLGSLYFNGTKDFASDDKQAFDYFMLAAEQGLPAAQSKLAQMYIDGLGVEKDQDKAKHYLYLALEQGDASAQLRLGKLFLDGADHNRKGDVDLSKWARGIHYLTLAANQDNEDAKKLNNFAKSRLTDLLIAEKKESNLGNVNASFSLAEYYLEEGPHQNIEEGLSYYKKAIDLGSPGAAFNLALICQNGILVTKNLEEAIKLFIIAAERGVYRGYGNIGAIYKERGDLKLAFKFFKLCAESKEANIVELDIFRARSQYELALMYKDGEGTMKDLVHSYAWASIAASDGEVRAEALVEDLKKIMDKDERREARELSRELYSKL